MSGKKSNWTACALVVGVAIGQATAAQAQTSPAENKQLIYIEPGPLYRVLDQLASRTGYSIEYDRKQLEGVQSEGVRGTIAFSDALDQAVKGTGVVVRRLGKGAVAIETPGAQAPGSSSSTVDERTGDIIVTAARVFGALRGDAPLTEIPQSIQIMSSKQLDEQNSFSLTDAMENATGITVKTSGLNSPVYSSRGFRVTNIHIDDGAAIDNLSGATAQITGAPDMGAYDHIEILRGADALFGGAGNPGASISLSRKEPYDRRAMKLYLSAGTWNNYRAEVDANVPLTSDGRLRFRTDLVSASTELSTDLVYQRLQNVFGTLAYDISDATTVTVGGILEHREGRDAPTGLPSYPDGTDVGLPRSLAITFPWAFFKTDTKEVFAKFTQDLGSRWQFKGGLTYRDRRFENLQAVFSNSPVNPVTNGLYGRPIIAYTNEPTQTKQLALDLTLTGSWRFLDIPVDMLLGVDHQRFRSRANNGFLLNYNYTIGDIFAFDPNSLANPFDNPNPLLNSEAGQDRVSLTTQSLTGIYGSARVHLTNRLALIGGGRWNYQKIDGSNNGVLKAAFRLPNGQIFDFRQTTAVDAPRVVDRQFSPFGGAVYNLDGSTSLYISYADIYASNGGRTDRDGNQLPALRGVNKEAGIKKMWNNGRLIGTVSVFDIRQRNILFFDFNAPTSADPLCCYLPEGENKSWGVEAELNGNIAPGWAFSAGYTFNRNKAQYGETLGSYTPVHLVKLWTSYRLPGKLSKFTVGGSVSFQSANYLTGTYNISQFCNGAVVPFCGNGDPVYTFRKSQKAYATADLRIAYAISDRFDLALSVNNLTDTRYFSTVGAPNAGSTYGAPRNVLVKLTSNF